MHLVAITSPKCYLMNVQQGRRRKRVTRYTRTAKTPQTCTIKSITLKEHRVLIETVTGKVVPLRMIGFWKDKIRWVEDAVETFHLQQT
jgi:hypothetical protein